MPGGSGRRRGSRKSLTPVAAGWWRRSTKADLSTSVETIEEKEKRGGNKRNVRRRVRSNGKRKGKGRGKEKD